MDPPEGNTVQDKARSVSARGPGPDERILETLGESAKRRTQLSSSLADQDDETFAASLERLHNEGLVRRRAIQEDGCVAYRYELSGLGQQVLDRL